MLLQCCFHISHPFIQAFTQFALSKMEFLKLVVGPFERAIIIEAANNHLIDHRLTDQILLRHSKIGVTNGTFPFLGNTGLTKRMCARMYSHGIPHHLLTLEAIEMLGIGGIDELELIACLFLHLIDGILDTPDTSCLTHRGIAML